MTTQFPRTVDSGQSEMRQTIRNVSATNGSIALAGTFQNVSIGNHPNVTTEEKIKQCRNALFISHPDLDRSALISAKGGRADGTCQWVLQNPHYQSWLAKEFPVLRISGGPGKGKTMLSLFLTDQLTALCQATGDRLLFFFCRFQDDRFNDPQNVLRSLTYQLLEFSHDCTELNEVFKYFENEEKTKDILSNFEGLWKIFDTLMSQPGLPTLWCIIDGIDECHSTEKLATKFYEYCSRCGQLGEPTRFQLLVLGRDIDESGITNIIRLDTECKETIERDVKSFIASSLKQLEKIPRFKDKCSDITDILVEKAAGSFLWVSFIIEELRRNKTCLEVENTVKSFPKGLNPTFARMLGGINPEYHQASVSILQWILFAKRPLALTELAIATAETASGTYSQAHAEATADMVQILGPFLQVRGDQVFLVHQSAEDYLMGIDDDPNAPLKGYSFTSNRCHGIISQRCLEVLKEHYSKLPDDLSGLVDLLDILYSISPGPFYLRDEDLAKYTLPSLKRSQKQAIEKFLSAQALEHAESSDTFLHYAKNYWDYHARLSATCPDDKNRQFFEDMVLQQREMFQRGANAKLPSIHKASELGIVRLLEALHRHASGYWQNNINTSVFESTPLGKAIEGGGDERTVKFLLEHGANQDSMREAFLGAAKMGQSARMQVLLEYGVTFRHSIKESVIYRLHRLALSSFPFLFDDWHLLNLETLWNDPASRYSESLLTLASYGHTEIIQALFDHYADAGVWTSCDINIATIGAASSGHLKTLELLLGYGADIESKNKEGLTALSAASLYGKMTAIEWLYKRGANIESRDSYGATPLIIAVRDGHTDIARYLIDHGASVNARDRSNETALVKAILGGNEKLVKYLQSCGAATDVVAERNRPLVLSAVEHDSELILEFLLQNGADPDGRDGVTPLVSALVPHKRPPDIYFTSLFIPSKSRRWSGDETLTTSGLFADISRNWFFYDVIPRKQLEHQAVMVKSLLKHGADITLCGRVYLYEPLLSDGTGVWTIHRCLEEETGWVVLDAQPLICAAWGGIDWAINLLIEGGADSNARATEWYLPKGFIPSIIKDQGQLIEPIEKYWNLAYNNFRRQLPQHTCSRSAGSALVYASMERRLTTVRLLLSFGADTSIEDGFGMTALAWASKKGFTEIEEVLKAHDEGRI